MKRLYHVISGLAGGVLLLAGCEGDTIVLDADPVAPEATTLSVTSDNPLYSAQEGRGTLRFKTPGGEVVFSVETNAETWSYTNDNEAWLAVEQNEYDGTLTLRVQRNEEASEPAAEVVVTAGEGSGARTWTVEVVQNAAGTPEIVATPNRVLIPACGSLLSASTEIACNYEDWEFTQSCDWMLVERRQDKLVFTADENTSSESRQVEVKLTAGYGDRSISETVVVEQDGRAFVRALPEALSFDYRGGTKTIAVSSNFEWNHAADAKWFAVTRENDVLTVTVDPYDGEQGRTENISLTTGVGENTASLEVAITQMGVNDKYLRWKFEIPSDNATATAMIAGEVDAEINWGDGTVETVTTANPTHVYATAGSYDVEVSGKVTALKSAGEKSYVVEVLQWGQTGLTSMEDAFNGCMNLKSIPSDTAHSFDGVTTFNEAFYDCQTLGAIPAGLFDNATRATDFTSTFHFCHSIPEIPEKLFYYNTEATSFSQTFYYVGSQVNKEAEGLLTEIPAGLFETNTKAQTFLSVFGHPVGSGHAVPELPERDGHDLAVRQLQGVGDRSGRPVRRVPGGDEFLAGIPHVHGAQIDTRTDFLQQYAGDDLQGGVQRCGDRDDSGRSLRAASRCDQLFGRFPGLPDRLDSARTLLDDDQVYRFLAGFQGVHETDIHTLRSAGFLSRRLQRRVDFLRVRVDRLDPERTVRPHDEHQERQQPLRGLLLAADAARRPVRHLLGHGKLHLHEYVRRVYVVAVAAFGVVRDRRGDRIRQHLHRLYGIDVAA